MHKLFIASGKKKRLLSFCVWTLSTLTIWLTPVIAGDVTGDFSSGYDNSTVESNNVDETVTNNYNATGAGSPAPVMSSIAPTVMGGGGNDSCLIPTSIGIQLSIVGISTGAMQQDEYCNRRKNARLLGAPQQVGGLGLQVSAISVLCQDPTVFRSMMLANTPCPINDSRTGRLLMGRDAINMYRGSPALYIIGYEEDTDFWDALLGVGEEYTNAEILEDVGPRLSISDQFRSTKR
jgi:hypothetical protein